MAAYRSRPGPGVGPLLLLIVVVLVIVAYYAHELAKAWS